MERTLFSCAVIAIVAIGLSALSVSANSGNAAPRATGYHVSWYSVAGGSAMNLTGGAFKLSGTIGQFDVGAQSGGTYTLNGGFWVSFDASGYQYYLPAISR